METIKDKLNIALVVLGGCGLAILMGWAAMSAEKKSKRIDNVAVVQMDVNGYEGVEWFSDKQTTIKKFGPIEAMNSSVTEEYFQVVVDKPEYSFVRIFDFIDNGLVKVQCNYSFNDPAGMYAIYEKLNSKYGTGRKWVFQKTIISTSDQLSINGKPIWYLGVTYKSATYSDSVKAREEQRDREKNDKIRNEVTL